LGVSWIRRIRKVQNISALYHGRLRFLSRSTNYEENELTQRISVILEEEQFKEMQRQDAESVNIEKENLRVQLESEKDRLGLVVESPRPEMKVECHEPQVVAEGKTQLKHALAALDSIAGLQNYQKDCFRILLFVLEKNVQTNTPSDPPSNMLIDDADSTKSITETELNGFIAMEEKMQKINSDSIAPEDLSKLDKNIAACFETLMYE